MSHHPSNCLWLNTVNRRLLWLSNPFNFFQQIDDNCPLLIKEGKGEGGCGSAIGGRESFVGKY